MNTIFIIEHRELFDEGHGTNFDCTTMHIASSLFKATLWMDGNLDELEYGTNGKVKSWFAVLSDIIDADCTTSTKLLYFILPDGTRTYEQPA